jgi:hypothetical protein
MPHPSNNDGDGTQCTTTRYRRKTAAVHAVSSPECGEGPIQPASEGSLDGLLVRYIPWAYPTVRNLKLARDRLFDEKILPAAQFVLRHPLRQTSAGALAARSLAPDRADASPRLVIANEAPAEHREDAARSRNRRASVGRWLAERVARHDGGGWRELQAALAAPRPDTVCRALRLL